jgi:hypothetical protein
MRKVIVFFFAGIIGTVSCQKNKGSNKDDMFNPYKNEFTACNCQPLSTKDEASREYIKFIINDVPICFDLKGNFTESFDNMLTYGRVIRGDSVSYYDNLYMIRYSGDGKFSAGIFMQNTHALTKKYPYELPRSNSEYCEIADLQITNLQKITSHMCYQCSNSDWHYYAPFFGSALKLIVDKYENGYFEGHFSGLTKTGSGRPGIIKDGSFRIKLTEIKRDVIVP